MQLIKQPFQFYFPIQEGLQIVKYDLTCDSISIQYFFFKLLFLNNFLNVFFIII